MKPLASNTLLQNRYLVVHLIGRGGMGEVYLAIDQRLGNPVALKRTVFFDDETLGNAFEREAKILARLRHAVLPKVSDHFLEEGNQYLVMEYIAGDDLSKRLEISNKPFPLDWVMFWADRILDALDYLHSNEPPIVHRDIKPQNLKLTEDNQIVLLDFGLSKNTVDAARVSTTAPSVVGYTPQYAPMEQIRGTGTNARSDIYSLSSTIYQLLTNTVPPDALSRADALLGGRPDPLQPINEINPQVSLSISEIILKGMEISQDKRFSTAREMQKLLRDAYSPVAQNRELVETAANPTISSTVENISLKTNITSTPKFDARTSQAEVKSNSDFSFDSKNLSEHYNSASPRKPTTSASSFGNSANGNFNGDAFSTSHSTGRISETFTGETTSDFAVSALPENKANKKSPLIFAGIGALVLSFAAIGFGFYIFRDANRNAEIAAPEAVIKTASVPNAEPAKQAEPSPNAVSEAVPNASPTTAKQVGETIDDSRNTKTIQPPTVKINQKPADDKTSKTAVKPTTKVEQKPSPLPRILP